MFICSVLQVWTSSTSFVWSEEHLHFASETKKTEPEVVLRILVNQVFIFSCEDVPLNPYREKQANQPINKNFGPISYQAYQ
jgi:hypothetical protein